MKSETKVDFMFYDNLKSVCDSKGLKITKVVTECGGALGSISKWKNGANPNSEIVARLAIRLNVSTDLLIFGKEDSKYKKFSDIIEHIQSLPEREQWKAIFRLKDVLKKEYPIDSIKQSTDENGNRQNVLI